MDDKTRILILAGSAATSIIVACAQSIYIDKLKARIRNKEASFDYMSKAYLGALEDMPIDVLKKHSDRVFTDIKFKDITLNF